MENKAVGLLGGPFYQMGYVTNDLARAIAGFGETMGVTRFLEIKDMPVAVGPGQDAVMSLALAWAGGMQIELIEPRGGADSVFRDPLTGPGFQLLFHHEAHVVEPAGAIEAIRGEAKRRGLAIVIDGDAGNGGGVTYVDARPLIGHYIEYLRFGPGARAAFEAAIPFN